MNALRSVKMKLELEGAAPERIAAREVELLTASPSEGMVTLTAFGV